MLVYVGEKLKRKMEVDNQTLSNRQLFVLAGMAATEEPVRFASIQIQKLFFLYDQKIRKEVGKAPYFDFKPYDYGPFDKTVFEDIEDLESKGLAEITSVQAPYQSRRKLYTLSYRGFNQGKKILEGMPVSERNQIRGVMRKLLEHRNFGELVVSIYEEYPHMRANSRFHG